MKYLFTGKYLLSKTRGKRCQPYLQLHFHSFSQENGLPSHLHGDISLCCQDQNKQQAPCSKNPCLIIHYASHLDSFTWLLPGIVPGLGSLSYLPGVVLPCLLDWETPLGPLKTYPSALPSQPFFLSPRPHTARCAYQSIVCFLGTAFPIRILLFSAVFLVLDTVSGTHWSVDGHCQMSRHFSQSLAQE